MIRSPISFIDSVVCVALLTVAAVIGMRLSMIALLQDSDAHAYFGVAPLFFAFIGVLVVGAAIARLDRKLNQQQAPLEGGLTTIAPRRSLVVSALWMTPITLVFSLACGVISNAPMTADVLFRWPYVTLVVLVMSVTAVVRRRAKERWKANVSHLRPAIVVCPECGDDIALSGFLKLSRLTNPFGPIPMSVFAVGFIAQLLWSLTSPYSDVQFVDSPGSVPIGVLYGMKVVDPFKYDLERRDDVATLEKDEWAGHTFVGIGPWWSRPLVPGELTAPDLFELGGQRFAGLNLGAPLDWFHFESWSHIKRDGPIDNLSLLPPAPHQIALVQPFVINVDRGSAGPTHELQECMLFLPALAVSLCIAAAPALLVFSTMNIVQRRRIVARLLDSRCASCGYRR